jgi:hypothetical protein
MWLNELCNRGGVDSRSISEHQHQCPSPIICNAAEDRESSVLMRNIVKDNGAWRHRFSIVFNAGEGAGQDTVGGE